LISNKVSASRDSVYNLIVKNIGVDGFLILKMKTYNESLATLALNRNGINKIFETKDRLIQKADPVFMKPESKFGRAQFFAPFKLIGNLEINTLIFNMLAVWFMTGLLFVTLYVNVIKRVLDFIENLHLPRLRKYKDHLF
jgi:ABC transport system ATP-binding/permease protein